MSVQSISQKFRLISIGSWAHDERKPASEKGTREAGKPMGRRMARQLEPALSEFSLMAPRQPEHRAIAFDAPLLNPLRAVQSHLARNRLLPPLRLAPLGLDTSPPERGEEGCQPSRVRSLPPPLQGGRCRGLLQPETERGCFSHAITLPLRSGGTRSPEHLAIFQRYRPTPLRLTPIARGLLQ